MNATGDGLLCPAEVVGYKVAGCLSVGLYSVVILGITAQLYHHIRHRSDIKRICFHFLLLLGILTETPTSLQYILNPNSPEWIAIFLCALYSQIMQCLALAIIALTWARTAVAGHQDGPITFEKVVIIGNVVILIFALATTIAVTTYPDTLDGQNKFMTSNLVPALMITGCITLLGTGCFLVVQGCRIASRLLRSRTVIGEDKVYHSLAKLIVSLWTIFLCILLRVFFTTCLAFSVSFIENMDIVPFTVWATLVPDVFPALCLLYLQRKTPTNDDGQRKPSRVISQVPSEPYTLHSTPSPQLIV